MRDLPCRLPAASVRGCSSIPSRPGCRKVTSTASAAVDEGGGGGGSRGCGATATGKTVSTSSDVVASGFAATAVAPGSAGVAGAGCEGVSAAAVGGFGAGPRRAATAAALGGGFRHPSKCAMNAPSAVKCRANRALHAARPGGAATSLPGPLAQGLPNQSAAR